MQVLDPGRGFPSRDCLSGIGAAAVFWAVGFAAAWLMLTVLAPVHPAGAPLRIPEPPAMTRLFVHNAAIGVVLLFGRMSGGALAAIGLLTLGFSFGAAAGRAFFGGWSAPLLLAAVAPHGVFELLAFLGLGAVGLTPLTSLLPTVQNRRTGAQPVRVTLIALALLGLASVLETTATPVILRWMLAGIAER